VLETQRLGEERILPQINLTYGEVVGRPPIGIDPSKLVIGKGGTRSRHEFSL
jgi:hypothetical protein